MKPIVPQSSGESSATESTTVTRAGLDVLRREFQAETAGLRHRLRGFAVSLVVALTIALLLRVTSPAIAQGYGVTLSGLLARVVAIENRATALENKTASMSSITDPNTNQPTVRFTEVNVQIVNGTNNTDSGTGNGKGNLIIGYNETRNNTQDPDIRTGSHNLVGGKANNYSGSGGVILGLQNNQSGGVCAMLGGYGNTVGGLASVVSGGQNNTATNSFNSVSGGLGNTASGIYASVSGGQDNTARSTASSVSGGLANTADGAQSSVTGGQLNWATGNSSCVNGGLSVRTTVGWSWAAGGSYYPSVGGGTFHSP